MILELLGTEKEILLIKRLRESNLLWGVCDNEKQQK